MITNYYPGFELKKNKCVISGLERREGVMAENLVLYVYEYPILVVGRRLPRFSKSGFLLTQRFYFVKVVSKIYGFQLQH